MLQHADRLSQLPITTLKIHQLQIIRGTIMAGEYQRDPSDFHLFTEEEYIDLIVDFVHRLRPDIVLERFVSQSPPALLLAPRWGWKNHEFTAKIRKGAYGYAPRAPRVRALSEGLYRQPLLQAFLTFSYIRYRAAGESPHPHHIRIAYAHGANIYYSL